LQQLEKKLNIESVRGAALKAWRMAFRDGNKGFEMWPQCLANGVASIAYGDLNFDLSQYPEGEPKKYWSKLSPAQRYSLKTFVWRIKRRHTIYVKQGPNIVGKGRVLKPYVFDRNSPVKGEHGDRWPHIIRVRWDSKFNPVRVQVGDTQQYTIRPLSQNDQRKVDHASMRLTRSIKASEAMEGETSKKEVKFRQRNRALVAAKKAASDYCCEVCEFSFEKTYGPLGKAFIIAHHIEPLGGRTGASRMSWEDIKLICANCHAMLHKQIPPLSPGELRRRLDRS
jgi:hypothetical protein